MDEGKHSASAEDGTNPSTPDGAPTPVGHTENAASGLRRENTEGDFELERPASAAPVASDEVRGGVSTSAGRAPVDRTPADHVPADRAPGGRAKPLHDPDPYSTPPYGEPGPYAPAPPVQHPGTTPAQGTAVPAATPGHATGTPRATADHGAPGQAVTPPHQNGSAGAAVTTHGTAAPGAGSTAHGTGLPAAGAHGTATPGADPAHGTATPGADPAHGTHVPAPAAPVLPGPRPAQVHAHHPSPAPDRQAQVQHPQAPAQIPQFPQAPQVPQAPQPSIPWQHYDPWAAAPLQQNGAVVDSKSSRRKRVRRLLLLGAVLIALVSGGLGGAVGAYLERNGGIEDIELPQAGTEAKGRAPDSVAGIAASALPSVVTLHVSGSEAQGTGTGFVLDERGHILTNHHVVEPAGAGGDISVTFSGGESAKAKLVGSDTGYDLAVVKVSGVSGLKPLPLGNSDNVQVGDPVVAIGAPFDLENTVTSGIISAKERPITAGGESGDGSDVSYVDALQTDAPINPGNSGGPLVDSKARVIGINSAIRSADSGSDLEGGQSGSIGLGFAIPINQGKRVAEELINTGKATHPVIGVRLDMDYTGDGARVGTKSGDGPTVTKGGPGDRAGIKAGDVITEVDGRPVRSGEELIVKTRAHRPGDRLELTVERDGKERKVTLVLGSADGD
ncbi:trypsin-like peptidase domain-containing protein [Streptomyces xiangluensis]|uniref:Trypsin-like peptidase domain-containing protein n=1 Tax=Streptomyces xiangluensis TaxID=2665720 RepID=A0ABV8YNI1_9ACTN